MEKIKSFNLFKVNCLHLVGPFVPCIRFTNFLTRKNIINFNHELPCNRFHQKVGINCCFDTFFIETESDTNFCVCCEGVVLAYQSLEKKYVQICLAPPGCNVFWKPFRSTNGYILPFIACPLVFI